MATYAALLSLTTTLNNIQIQPRVSTLFYHKQIQSLHQIIHFLLHFIETTNNCHGVNGHEEALERRIAFTTHAAEYAIESHVVHQILAGSTDFFDLHTQIEDMKSVKETVMAIEFQGKMKFEDEQSYRPASKPTTAKKEIIVGFDEKLCQIMDRLTAHQPALQVVPIVGMGGIGKTTLAKSVYDNLFIVDSFDIRAWITISQVYSVKNVLSELLSSIKDPKINVRIGEVDFQSGLETEDHKLGVELYQTLWGRRYLIVLDDIWSLEAWDKITCFFPNNGNRSRVVITTRISSVATHLSSSSFEMDFLDQDQSWELFCGTVFQERGCPPELEEIGRKIVRECKGLPLSIVVIGGILRNSTSTSEYWENFARDLNSNLMSGNDAHCLNILSLSYNHLPAHLKPCFLYMGFFEEDVRISVSQLIHLLVVEGFVKPIEGQTLEEVAEGYLNDLVDRNLILVHSWKWNGRIKSCKIHDVIREVCLKICERDKIFHSMRKLDTARLIRKKGWNDSGRNPIRKHDIARFIREKGWYDSEHNPFGKLDAARLIREKGWDDSGCNPFPTVLKRFLPSAVPLALTFTFSDYGPLLLQFQMGRVLNSLEFKSLDYQSQHFNLRYHCGILEHMISESRFPSSVSLFWNVHTLVLTGQLEAASEIWYMRQLRHLHFTSIFLPNPPPPPPPPGVEQQDDALLPNVQTLSTVMNFSFTEEVCKNIPNIRKLGIAHSFKYMEYPKECYYSLNHLHKLESLFCSFNVPKRDDLLQSLVFPSSLRKLSLNNCGLHWEDLNTFGLSLPSLEVLKLYLNAVEGPKWDCAEGAFPCLKFLQIDSKGLINWIAENSNFFPVLEKLHLGYLSELEKIPSGIGEIQTLGCLLVHYCSLSAAISTTEILEEQLSLGNEDLQVVVCLMPEEKDSFMEMVDITSFTSKNLQVIFSDKQSSQLFLTKKYKLFMTTEDLDATGGMWRGKLQEMLDNLDAEIGLCGVKLLEMLDKLDSEIGLNKRGKLFRN